MKISVSDKPAHSPVVLCSFKVLIKMFNNSGTPRSLPTCNSLIIAKLGLVFSSYEAKPKDLDFLSLCACQSLVLTSGERRVQLLVEEPVLPVLLLLSDIALWRLRLAQHHTDSPL